MRRAFLRKRTWVLLAALVFAAGDFALHMRMNARRDAELSAVTAPDAGAQDLVSRADDSELEVEPHLAAQPDGRLAVAWMASGGGRDEGGARYIGVRVSAPGPGKWGPLVRVRSPAGMAADPVLSPRPDGSFTLTWLAPGSPSHVYSARILADGAEAPIEVATAGAIDRPWSTVTPGGTTVVVFDYADGKTRGVAAAVAHDGVHFTRTNLAWGEDFTGELPRVCADDHLAVVTYVDSKQGVVVHQMPLDPQGPVGTTVASSPNEHVAREPPACFLSGQDTFVVYATTDKPVEWRRRAVGSELEEAPIIDSMVFARSRDGGRTFWGRAAHRPSSKLLHPTLVRAESGAFGMLAMMGAGAGDTHGSASVVALSTDGRSQSGLTRTALAPVTFAVRRDGPGYVGDYLGFARVGDALFAAVVDNAAGEAHVAVVRVP
ncbi:MAG TPA: hypothetical protein VLM85_25695 [Polyangiaceae bacterium]|nr:hypothetical protein [Polyangiaceae bacterium]